MINRYKFSNNSTPSSLPRQLLQSYPAFKFLEEMLYLVQSLKFKFSKEESLPTNIY